MMIRSLGFNTKKNPPPPRYSLLWRRNYAFPCTRTICDRVTICSRTANDPLLRPFVAQIGIGGGCCRSIPFLMIKYYASPVYTHSGPLRTVCCSQQQTAAKRTRSSPGGKRQITEGEKEEAEAGWGCYQRLARLSAQL